MSDDVLESLANVIERSGAYPSRPGCVVVPVIPKPDRGLHPIASFRALYRVAMKARKGAVGAWATSIERDYFTAREGSGAIDQIWRQAATAGHTVAEGGAHVAILWDIAKMLDRAPHGLVA